MDSISDDRLTLSVKSACSIFSRSKQQWFDGTISKIWIDKHTNQEWLVVKYGSNKSKKIQRFCEDLRVMPPIASPSQGWEELTCPPFDIHQYSNMVPINAMEYCLATEMIDDMIYNDESDTGGIYVYSVIVNDWMLLRQYPQSIPWMKATKLSIAFNVGTSELYIYGVHENPAWSVLAKLNVYSRRFTHCVCKSYSAGVGATAMIIDGVFHIIGGTVSNLHAIFNEATQCFDVRYPINNDNNMEWWSGNTSGLKQHGVVHINNAAPEGETLWVLGGTHDDRNAYDQIWRHDLSGTWHHLAPDAAWNELAATLPHKMMGMGCCVGYNRYIITLGGKMNRANGADRDYNVHDIYIMDIAADKMKFEMMSEYELPNADECSSYNAIVLPKCPVYDANLLVSGFIKNYVCKGYDAFVSKDIIQLIFTFSRTEYIYVIQNDQICPKQWRIGVDDIINSMTHMHH